MKHDEIHEGFKMALSVHGNSILNKPGTDGKAYRSAQEMSSRAYWVIRLDRHVPDVLGCSIISSMRFALPCFPLNSDICFDTAKKGNSDEPLAVTVVRTHDRLVSVICRRLETIMVDRKGQ